MRVAYRNDDERPDKMVNALNGMYRALDAFQDALGFVDDDDEEDQPRRQTPQPVIRSYNDPRVVAQVDELLDFAVAKQNRARRTGDAALSVRADAYINALLDIRIRFMPPTEG